MVIVGQTGEGALNLNLKCIACDSAATILMNGYAEKGSDVVVCDQHATQLSRKLLEDLSETVGGGRHG